MTQQSTPPSKALCLATNDSYRNTILNLCKTCYHKAETPQEFTDLMETLTQLTTKISDYPNIDQTFIHGATLALVTLKGEQQ